VVAHNAGLLHNGTYFVAGRAYSLPRNVGQELYQRVSVTGGQGRYYFEGLAGGLYDVEVTTEGHRPLQQQIEVDPAAPCVLELVPAE
jgi:hypothetical protein